MPSLVAVGLFSGAGIGDIGFSASGINFVAMCEIEEDRAALARENFPNCRVFSEDVHKCKDALVKYVQESSSNEPFLVTCTAPCQGMSKSGQGTLLNNIRQGKRPKLDPRNRLILPALDILKSLRPVFVVFENVCEMRSTTILDSHNRPRKILDIIRSELPGEYVGEAYDVEFADYGIPQRRKRLITVYTRDEIARRRFQLGEALIPEPTHSRNSADGKHKWVSVMDAIGHFPPLNGRDFKSARDATIPFHRVPTLDEKKYEWVRNTPTGASAFDNQCTNPACLYQGNRAHSNQRSAAGINQASKKTPLHCEKCGSLLPRPYTVDSHGNRRIMSGYTSAYKRMDANLPCPALTRNLSFACSDHKVHPFQNRVLSLAEAFVIHSLSRYDYKWRLAMGNQNMPKPAPDTLVRLVLGESVPPYFLELLGKHLINLALPERIRVSPRRATDKQLFLSEV